MNNILELVLDNVSSGLYLLETNNLRIISECVNKISEQLKTLCVDFSQYGVDFYNKNIKNGFEAVVFYRFDLLEDVNVILSSCNFNRDNFIERDIPMFFIVSTGIKNIIRTDFPNLSSYFMTSIELDESLEIPFRQIMSIDRFTFSNSLVFFSYKGNLMYSEIIKSQQHIMDDFVAGYMEAVPVVFNNVGNEMLVKFISCERLLSGFFDDVITLIMILIYDRKLDKVTYIIKKMSQVILGKDIIGLNDDDPLGVLIWFNDLIDDYLKYDIFTRIQLVKFFYQLATITFFQNNYQFAAYLFSTLLEWMYTFDKATMTIEEREIIVGMQLDYLACLKEIGGFEWKIQKFLNNEFNYDEMQTKTQLVFRYNKLLYSLIFKYNINIDEEISYFNVLRRVFPGDGIPILKYSTLVAWALGCHYGYLEEAIKMINDALKEIKYNYRNYDFFTGNFYVLAEAKFCKGVLLWLSGDLDSSKLIVQNAISILENNEYMNESSLKIMRNFLDTKFNNCDGIDK